MSDKLQTWTMENIDLEDEDSYLGIGWYHGRELVGVVKKIKSECKPNRFGISTVNQLHKNIWYKIAKENPGFAGQFKDYTHCPRFRIFYYAHETPHWRVMCGAAIRDSESAKSLIHEEFNLYPTDAEFIADSHWELGHGWSKEFMDGLSFS
ncbi:MAG: hypothetical protein Pg6C_20960 [Treponemataceae bacterium]|nr:MAG: hypothetical protein Pg6C_20960 [Treponemataceae bacterium]